MYLVIYVYNHCVHAYSPPRRSLCPSDCIYSYPDRSKSVLTLTTLCGENWKESKHPDTGGPRRLGGASRRQFESYYAMTLYQCRVRLLYNDPVHRCSR